MKEQDKSFVAMKAKGIVSKEQYARLKELAETASDKIGMPVLVVDEPVDVGMHQDLAPKLKSILEEQRKTNQLLMMLIESMAEYDSVANAEPQYYLDGTPMGYHPSTGLSGPPGDE